MLAQTKDTVSFLFDERICEAGYNETIYTFYIIS